MEDKFDKISQIEAFSCYWLARGPWQALFVNNSLGQLRKKQIREMHQCGDKDYRLRRGGKDALDIVTEHEKHLW